MSKAPVEIPDRFKWVGGRLCLDFINTVGGRIHGDGIDGPGYRIRVDKLRSLADLSAWERGEQAKEGAARRAGDPAAARRALGRVVALREALYRLFRAAIRGEEFPADALDLLSTELRAGRRRQRLVARNGEIALAPDPAAAFPEELLARIVESAVEILTGDGRARLRQCPGPDCGWLFLDASRNGKRRWCDMNDCGNLAKVHRFRSRQRRQRNRVQAARHVRGGRAG